MPMYFCAYIVCTVFLGSRGVRFLDGKLHIFGGLCLQHRYVQRRIRLCTINSITAFVLGVYSRECIVSIYLYVCILVRTVFVLKFNELGRLYQQRTFEIKMTVHSSISRRYEKIVPNTFHSIRKRGKEIEILSQECIACNETDAICMRI